NSVTFKGGYDLKAVELFIEFITSKFFSNEGFHVLEHVLLRPKVKGPQFINASETTLTEGLANLGSLYFNKKLPLYSASIITNVFRVEGDLTSGLDASETTDKSSEFTISDTGANDAVYKVKSVSFDAGTNRTAIKPVEKIHSEISHFSPFGDIIFMKGTAISSLSAANLSVTVSDADTLNVEPGEIIEIRGSTGKINDGRYMAKEVLDNSGSQD